LNKIVALIPARSGSKRIANKNIKLLNGHPLIGYAISTAIQSDVFDNVVVSTDSLEYGAIAEQYGAQVCVRPEKYSGDNSPDIEWVTHALSDLYANEKKYDLFSILRPTNPFRMPETIKRALSLFQKEKSADSIRAVEICTQHPAKMWRVKDDFMAPILVGNNNGVPWHSCQFSSLPKIYVQNASLEIAWTSVALGKRSIAGDKIMPFITEGYEGFDINQPYDWEYASYLIENKLAQLPPINTTRLGTE
jgi:N-acylneuraminate cytidylyltransferase